MEEEEEEEEEEDASVVPHILYFSLKRRNLSFPLSYLERQIMQDWTVSCTR